MTTSTAVFDQVACARHAAPGRGTGDVCAVCGHALRSHRVAFHVCPQCRLEVQIRAGEAKTARVDTRFKVVRARHEKATVEAMSKVFRAMRADAQARFDSGAKVLIGPRWADELKDTAFTRNKATAAEVGVKVFDALRKAARALEPEDDYDPDDMDGWLDINARFAGDGIAATTADQLTAAVADPDNDSPIKTVFEALLTIGVEEIAQRMVSTAVSFGATDAAQAAGAGTKEWQVNSSNPRPTHAGMDGEIAALSDTFSNGMMWPGDPEAGPDETCGCDCSVTIIK